MAKKRTQLPEGDFLHHAPCPNPQCGSSDGLAVYSSGTGYCYVCDTYFPSLDADGVPIAEQSKAPAKTPRKASKKADLIPVNDFVALSKRSLEAETCKRYGYGIGKLNGKTVQVGSYKWQGARVAQHIRDADKNFAWLGDVKQMELFGQHLWAKGGRKVCVTEGEIDCMSIAQVLSLKWPVVSLPSGAQSAAKYILMNLEWLESFDEVVLAFDDDKAGKDALEKVIPLFTVGKVKIMQYNGYKDANELLVEEGPAAVLQCYYNSTEYRPDGIVAGVDLWDVVKDPPKRGVQLQFKKFSEMVFGVRPAELYLFTAGSGMGKSTIVHEIGYELMMEHGQTLGVMALEENPRRTAERYLGINLNRTLHLTRDGVNMSQLKEAFKATVGNGRFYLYDHWGSQHIDVLLAKLRYMAVALKVNWIILDHISIVVSGLEDSSGEGERKMIDMLMTRLRSLIEETGVGVIAIVHLKRTQKNYNEGAAVSLSDLRGSASLEQLSDVVVSVERNQQGENPNIAQIRVLKNRPVGVTGVADSIIYNPDTGRLLPMEGSSFLAGGPRPDANDDF